MSQSLASNLKMTDCRMTWILRGILFVFSVLFLGVYNSDFLFGTQECLFFTSDSIYYENTTSQTGGLLMYVSSFLTQFLYYPMLGAFLLSLLLVAVEIVVERLFSAGIFSYVPSVLLLFAISSVGYAIYDRFDVSFLFSSIIGVLCALGMLALSRAVSRRGWGICVLLVVASLSYFAIGVYALFAVLLIIADVIHRRDGGALFSVALGVISSVSVVYVGANFVNHEFYSSALYSPLPEPLFKLVFSVCMCNFAVLIALAFYGNALGQILFFRKYIVECASLLILLVATFVWSYRDVNFNAEIRVAHLAEERKWAELVAFAESVEHPTRPVIMYRAVSLAMQDKLADRLFDYTCEFSKTRSKFVTEQPLMNEDFFLHSSFFNEAYLWSMEFWTSIGERYSTLKHMVLFSLLNDETDMARKYNDVLKKTLFQRTWAEKMDKYISNPASFYGDYPEYAAVRSETPQVENVLHLESLTNAYQRYSFLSYKNAERRLLMDMYKKDMKSFLNDFNGMRGYYAKNGMPKCIQEAVLLCAFTISPQIVKDLNIDKELVFRVDSFMRSIKSTPKKEMAQKNLKRGYGDSYYYYFYFSSFK